MIGWGIGDGVERRRNREFPVVPGVGRGKLGQCGGSGDETGVWGRKRRHRL